MIVADVYKGERLAAYFSQTESGEVVFAYAKGYAGPPVATSLPLGAGEVVCPPGQIPAFFAGLLPEGYRLTRLARQHKISLSNELALLLEVGRDTPGDVQILAPGERPGPGAPLIDGAFSACKFADLLDRPDGKSLPGVQEKVSALMISLPARVRTGSAGRACDVEGIVKLTPRSYPHLVANEYAHMQAAQRLGLAVAKSQLVTDSVGEQGLFIERFDRACDDGVIRRIAFEDAAQILELVPAAKYDVTAEQVIAALCALTAAPLVANQKMFTQFLFAWATGNGDLHAKNIALLGSEFERELAPIYDVPCTLVYGDDEMALSIGGKKKGLKAKHWRQLARDLGLPGRALAGIAGVVLAASAAVDWEALPFNGSVLNGCLRELRARRYELEDLVNA